MKIVIIGLILVCSQLGLSKSDKTVIELARSIQANLEKLNSKSNYLFEEDKIILQESLRNLAELQSVLKKTDKYSWEIFSRAAIKRYNPGEALDAARDKALYDCTLSGYLYCTLTSNIMTGDYEANATVLGTNKKKSWIPFFGK